MKNLEEQLNSLPKAKLSLMADLRIRYKLYVLIWKKRSSRLFSAEMFTVRRMVPASLVFIFLIITTIPAYAYESSGVTYGHILYPVKRLIENVEVNMNKSDVGQVKVYEKLAARRLEEAAYLSKNNENGNNDNLAKTLNEAMTAENKAVEISDKATGSPNEQKVNDIIESSQKKQTEVLSRVAQNVGIKADENIVDAITLSIDNITGIFSGKKRRGVQNDNEASGTFSTFPDTTEATSTMGTEEPGDSLKDQESSTSTVTSGKNNIRKLNKIKAGSRDRINNARKNADKLLENLKSEDIAGDEVDTLKTRLDAKIENAQKAYSEGDLKKADTLIEESTALTKNAKFFIKAKKPNNINKVNTNTGLKKDIKGATTTKEEYGDNVTSSTVINGSSGTDNIKKTENNNKKSNGFFKFFKR